MKDRPGEGSSQPGLTHGDTQGAQLDGMNSGSSNEGRNRRRRLPGDVCAVFVHAGAGYHSVQNERVHLKACEE